MPGRAGKDVWMGRDGQKERSRKLYMYLKFLTITARKHITITTYWYIQILGLNLNQYNYTPVY